MITFRDSDFREEKAIAAAAFLVKLNGGACDKYWLNKVMYYVERSSIIKNGQPMFFDNLYSLPYGPIVSAVKDSIDDLEYPIETDWDHYLTLNGKEVRLINEPDLSFLSDFEIQIITESHQMFKGWDFSRLHHYFRDLPEHTETRSRVDIDYKNILLAAGYKKEDVDSYDRELIYMFSLNQIQNCK